MAAVLTCYVMPCECTQSGSCPLFSLQPISNADFIVPVEIEGTTHQVHGCVHICCWGEVVCVDVFAAVVTDHPGGAVTGERGPLLSRY